MAFADLWRFTPRDVDAMTLAEFDRFREGADERIAESNRRGG